MNDAQADPVERLRAQLSSSVVMSLAGSLVGRICAPGQRGGLNLCERRENFLIGFVALLMRGQTCLMPPSRAPAVVAEVLQAHPGAYVLDDSKSTNVERGPE